MIRWFFFSKKLIFTLNPRTSIFVCLGLLVFGCVYSFFKYKDLKDQPEAEGTFFDQGKRNIREMKVLVSKLEILDAGLTTDLQAYTDLSSTWLVFFIIFIVVIVIVVLMLIFLRKRLTEHKFPIH